MLAIQGTQRANRIAGLKKDGSVELIPNLLAVRKHVIDEKGWERIEKVKNVFGFVSSPKIIKQKKLLNQVSGWCHAFREPDRFFPDGTKNMLMPESDFMDPMFLESDKKHKKKKYDYFYFTHNSGTGIEYKGLYSFIDILPKLCKKNLRGLVIVYFPNSGRPYRFTVKLNKKQRRILDKYEKYIKYHWGKMSVSQMNIAMQSCRFGLFPNIIDNSPRLITECLIRDTPLLMNEEIVGGWHYINDNTGELFNINNISEKIDIIINRKHSPREYFMSHYGFKRSSSRLAKHVEDLFDISGYTNMYFRQYIDILKRIRT